MRSNRSRLTTAALAACLMLAPSLGRSEETLGRRLYQVAQVQPRADDPPASQPGGILNPPPPPPRKDEERPFYKTWWFWALTAVVAGGTVALGVAGHQSTPTPPRPCASDSLACFGAGR